MKKQVTKREIMKDGKRVIAISYCAAQRLLSTINARYYTAGVYGWNADVYEFGGAYIVTGYRPFGQHVDYDLLKKYEAEAAATPYENRIDVLERFIKEVI